MSNGITSSLLIKELREKTDAGIMDCKKALADANGDINLAVDLLRKKGLAMAIRRSDRVANEGAIAVNLSGDNKSAAIVELNSETDFVSRNDKFQQLIKRLANIAYDLPDEILQDVEVFKNTKIGDMLIQDLIYEVASVVGENITLRRVSRVRVKDGIVAAYVHNLIGDHVGKVGVIVAIESTGDKRKLAEFGKQVAMHIAAFKPDSLDIAGLNNAVVEKERSILYEQAQGSGKSAEIIEKMIGGRLQKLYQEVVLLEQPFVMDNKQSVKDVMMRLGKEIDAPVTVTSFVRFGLGEKS